MRNHNSKRELEKHVPYKAQKEHSKQHDALLPMSAENGAVTWEKGTGALQKWPLFSIGHDSSTKDFFCDKHCATKDAFVRHRICWSHSAGLARASFLIRTIIHKIYHRIKNNRTCTPAQSHKKTQHNATSHGQP